MDDDERIPLTFLLGVELGRLQAEWSRMHPPQMYGQGYMTSLGPDEVAMIERIVALVGRMMA